MDPDEYFRGHNLIIRRMKQKSGYARKYVPRIPEAPRKNENGTSGSARHPIVLRIQSEASIPILGYSLIGQI